MATTASIFTVLRFLWSRADQLAELIDKLPPALNVAGSGLNAAGDGALLAGKRLSGLASAVPDAGGPLADAAGAIRQVQAQLTELAEDVRAIAAALDSVRVPVVNPVRQRFNLKVVGLGEPELITGLEIGEHQPSALSSVAARLRNRAGSMEGDLTGYLEKAATGLDRLGDSLTDAGHHVTAAGESLRTGGRALEEFAL